MPHCSRRISLRARLFDALKGPSQHEEGAHEVFHGGHRLQPKQLPGGRLDDPGNTAAQGTLKSFVITLATWAILFALLWYGAHELFYPPGDWIGALVVSFFAALGIGGLRKARLERCDAAIVARSKEAPRDGARVAITGTLEPVAGVLTAPLSGEACVLYDYEITHVPETRGNDDARPSPVVDRGGMAMAPVVIRSGTRDVRLLAYPGIEGFEPADLEEDVVDRARRYIAATQFEEHSLVEGLKYLSLIMDDRSGSLRTDFKNTDHDDLESSGFKERRVPAHAKVCAIGLYSAKDNAIVPQDNVGGVRLISGTRQDALRLLRASSLGSIILAVLFISIPGPAAYGLLSLRERYNEEEGLPSVWKARTEAFHAAVAAGDAAAVRASLQRGADVNELNMNGIPALAMAGSMEVATALLEAGAMVDRRDKGGYTPLMLQARDGRVDVVRLLISRGADLSRSDNVGDMNALDIAIANGQDSVAAVLREAGARPGNS